MTEARCGAVKTTTRTFVVRHEEVGELIDNCMLADQPLSHQVREALEAMQAATDNLLTALGCND
jgi:hypothetical protein